MHIPGVQYRPPDNSDTFYSRISEAFKIVLGINDKVPKVETLGKGERIAYASDSGNIVCSVYYKNDGIIEVNGNSDFAVSYTDLNAQLQLLVSAINAALGTKANGSGTPGTLTLDLTAAKVNTVKLP